MLDKLAGVKNAQLLMIGNIITAEGTMLDPDELSTKVFETTHLPVYTGNRLQINGKKSGAVGGIVVSPYVQGKAAGLMAKQILDGVDVRKIPVRTEPLTRPFSIITCSSILTFKKANYLGIVLF